MTDNKPLNCPCCGSTATVEPHLIEAGVFTDDQTWPAWWTASVNCDSCALQFIGGGDTEGEAVEDALEGWNRRMAVSSVYTETLKAELGKAMVLMREMLADKVDRATCLNLETGERFMFECDAEEIDGWKERMRAFGIEVDDD